MNNSGMNPGDPVIFRGGEAFKDSVIFNKGMADQSIISNAQSVRSLSGNLLHISDYAKMADDTPALAKENADRLNGIYAAGHYSRGIHCYVADRPLRANGIRGH